MSDQSNPGSNALAVTPSDTTVFDTVTRGLYVSTGGDLSVRMAGGDGNTVVFTALPDGCILPIMVRSVNATGTTASGIVRLW